MDRIERFDDGWHWLTGSSQDRGGQPDRPNRALRRGDRLVRVGQSVIIERARQAETVERPPRGSSKACPAWGLSRGDFQLGPRPLSSRRRRVFRRGGIGDNHARRFLRSVPEPLLPLTVGPPRAEGVLFPPASASICRRLSHVAYVRYGSINRKVCDGSPCFNPWGSRYTVEDGEQACARSIVGESGEVALRNEMVSSCDVLHGLSEGSGKISRSAWSAAVLRGSRGRGLQRFVPTSEASLNSLSA